MWLRVKHPNFVTKTIFVATREKLHLAPANTALPLLHAATFAQALSPAKSIRGIVREDGTGKPLAGATVYVRTHPSNDSSEAITAADGRFTITGLGEAERYFCVVVSSSGQPHLRRELWVNAAPGSKPLDVEVKLFRGALVQGRVKNKSTGQPIFGAVLTYLPAPDNPHDSLTEGGFGYFDQQRFTTDRDGNFNVAIPAGPGLIGVRAMFDGSSGRFRDCRKEEFPARLEMEDGEHYFKSATGRIVRPEEFHAVVKVDAKKDGAVTDLRIELKPR